MTKSETINELAAALAKAQGQIKGATKDSENPYFKSKYADLAAVWDACRTALSSNGLAVSQTLSGVDGAVVVSTMLMHSSGQWIEDTLTLTPKDASPQAFGSAATYGRRYALAAIVGVAPEDDDGNAATQGAKPAQAPRHVTEASKRIALPPGTVQILRVQPKSKGAVEWADVTFVTDAGDEQTLPAPADAIGAGAALFEQLAQEAAPVILTTKINAKKKTVIEAVKRYAEVKATDENTILDAQIAASEGVL